MTNRSRPARFRPFTLAVLALLPFAASADPWAGCPAESLRPTKVTATDQPVEGVERAPANDVGCLFGVPLDAGDGVTLFRCLVDAPEDGIAETAEAESWSHALLVLQDGKPQQAIADDLMAGNFPAWQLLKVDLDGDGARENVVALWNAQGNGLGVNTWTLHVFAADWQLLDTRKDVLDWGPSALRQAPAPRAGCDLAATSFVEDNSTGKDGIAYEARFLRLQGGKLVEADDQPPLRRRYTFAFQDERTAWFERDPDSVEGDPAGWLRGATP